MSSFASLSMRKEKKRYLITIKNDKNLLYININNAHEAFTDSALAFFHFIIFDCCCRASERRILSCHY